MVNYFLHNRHGSISVMLSVMLIAVLSLSSSLMETARYKSTQRLFDELEQNAAFSLLGSYDRDLYEHFGLLALNSKEESTKLKQYLQYNLAGVGSEMTLNGVDTILDIGDVTVDGIYDLTQMEVLHSQIMEFTAYRAPAELADNILDIEKTLSELGDKLSELLPMLEAIKDLTSSIDSMLDTFIKMDSLIKEADKLQKAVNTYKDKIKELNNAIDEKNKYIEEHDESEDGYTTELDNKTNAIKTKTEELQAQIELTNEQIWKYYDTFKEFHEAYGEMLNKEIGRQFGKAKSSLADISNKETKENCETLLDDMKSNYDASVDLCGTLVKKLEQGYGTEIQNKSEKLDEQNKDLATALNKPEDMEKVESIEGLDDTNTFMSVVIMVLQYGQQIYSIVTGWNDSMAKMGDAIKVMNLYITKGVADLDLNSILSTDFMNSLPGGAAGKTLKSVNNPFETVDETVVSKQLDETKKIAEKINFDISSMDPKETFSEASALETAMTQMYNASVEYQKMTENLRSESAITILFTLKDIVKTLITFYTSLVNLITVFITNMSIENITKMIYQKMWIAVYANSMFSNRTTDGGSKLNGTGFEDLQTLLFGDDSCFDQANVEYIIAGTSSEIVNQTMTFMILLAWRLIANIPTVLTDKTLMQFITDLCALPIVGWIAAVIILGVFIFMEAWADVVFLVYTTDGVELYKTKGYFSLDGQGLDNYAEKVEAMFNTVELKKKDKNRSKDENSSFVTDYADGLLKLQYSDYTLLTLMLFRPKEEILARTANLIQMQMSCIKRNSGELDEFKLENMATYIRVEAQASYTPLLPIPTIPGINDNGIKMKVMHYSGY